MIQQIPISIQMTISIRHFIIFFAISSLSQACGRENFFGLGSEGNIRNDNNDSGDADAVHADPQKDVEKTGGEKNPDDQLPEKLQQPNATEPPKSIDTANPAATPPPMASNVPNTNDPCLNSFGDSQAITMIHSVGELKAIDNKPGNYALAQDISFQSSDQWTPIQLTFSVFDGRGHTISNLAVPMTPGGGLFSSIGNSMLHDLKLQHISVNLNYTDGTQLIGWVGGLAGLVMHSTLENVSVDSAVVRGNSSVGGLIGAVLESGVGCRRQVHTVLKNLSAANIRLETIGPDFIPGAIASIVIAPTKYDLLTQTNVDHQVVGVPTTRSVPLIGRIDN